MSNDDRLEQRIRNRAHRLWEKAGRPDGQDKEHWELAAQQIMLEDSRSDGAATTELTSRAPTAAPEPT